MNMARPQVVASLRSALEGLAKFNGMVWSEVTDACGSEAVRSTVSMRTLNRQALAQAKAMNAAAASTGGAGAAEQQESAVAEAKAASAADGVDSATMVGRQQGATMVHARVPGAGGDAAGRHSEHPAGGVGAQSVAFQGRAGGLASGEGQPKAMSGTAPMAGGQGGMADEDDEERHSARAGSHAEAGVSGRQHSGTVQHWLQALTGWRLGRWRLRSVEADVEAGGGADKVSDEDRVSLRGYVILAYVQRRVCGGKYGRSASLACSLNWPTYNDICRSTPGACQWDTSCVAPKAGNKTGVLWHAAGGQGEGGPGAGLHWAR